jgi:Lon-like protease
MARTAIQAVAMVSSLVDTQQSIVMEPNPEVRAPNRRHLWWALPLAALGLVAVIGVLLSAALPSTLHFKKSGCDAKTNRDKCKVQFAIVPADAQPVQPRLQITGPTTYPTADEVLFVTVRSPELSLLDYWVGRDSPAVDGKTYGDLYATETPQEQTTRGQRDMRTAKETAEYVALHRLGFDATLTPGEVVIDHMVCVKVSADGRTCADYAPSDKVLDPDDKLVKVDGVAVSVVDDLSPILAKHKPGDTIRIDYERGGKQAFGDVTLIASPEQPDRTIVGFLPSDTSKVVLPADVKISIDTESIGGPSAGLAFTLTLIDQLSKGDLLGGKRIAVTGTIDIHALVGPIGGLSSKASAVLQSGAKYFLVPTAQGDADIAKARLVVGDAVEIIPVATLDEALAALRRIGGDELPPAPTTTDSAP